MLDERRRVYGQTIEAARTGWYVVRDRAEAVHGLQGEDIDALIAERDRDNRNETPWPERSDNQVSFSSVTAGLRLLNTNSEVKKMQAVLDLIAPPHIAALSRELEAEHGEVSLDEAAANAIADRLDAAIATFTRACQADLGGVEA